MLFLDDFENLVFNERKSNNLTKKEKGNAFLHLINNNIIIILFSQIYK